MNFNNFRLYFSHPRTERYYVSTKLSKQKSLELYQSNLVVSQSFYPLLSILEIIIRNRINDVLSDYFKDQNWILNQKTEFMSDPSLKFKNKITGQEQLNDFLKAEVIKAEKKLTNRKEKLSSSKIIAELSMGFWISFFDLHHYKLLKGRPIQLFNYLPSNCNRKIILDELNQIRQFRNRIYHNEHICFKNSKVDFSNAESIYQSILSLLNWIDPEIVKFTKAIDQVEYNLIKAKKLG